MLATIKHFLMLTAIIHAMKYENDLPHICDFQIPLTINCELICCIGLSNESESNAFSVIFIVLWAWFSISFYRIVGLCF